MTPMPNRFAEVGALCLIHPEAFPPGEQNDAARLTFLKSTVIPILNEIDGGNWGLMTKTEQNNRVPVDVIMWRQTREFVDCLTGTGAAWLPFPPAPAGWVWTEADWGIPDDTPAVGPVPTLNYDESQVIAFIDDAVQVYKRAHVTPDPYAAIWATRMQYDFFTMGYAAARAKHLNELRQTLGLS